MVEIPKLLDIEVLFPFLDEKEKEGIDCGLEKAKKGIREYTKDAHPLTLFCIWMGSLKAGEAIEEEGFEDKLRHERERGDSVEWVKAFAMERFMDGAFAVINMAAKRAGETAFPN